VVSKNESLGLGATVINLDARAWMRATTRTDFVWDESRWSPFKQFIPWLRHKGFHVCLWENPYVSSATETVYGEGVKKGYFAKDSSGGVYPYQWVPTGLEGFPQPPIAGLVDFTNPEARSWWKDMHRPYLKAGVTCFKTDFGEEIPVDTMFYDGSTGKQLRNVYSDLYNLCVMEVLEEECGDQGILWARSGYTKMAQTPVKWAGDSQTSWAALKASLRGGLSQAVGGAIFWSHDIGGFYGPMPSPELFLRWTQVGLWGSHARMHGTSPREPWEFGEEVLAQVKKDVAFRHKVKDYFIASGKACTLRRQSFIQPLWLHHSADPISWTIDDQFFSGSNDLLIAPYLTPSGGRQVYLPKGTWFCLANKTSYSGQSFHDFERYPETLAFLETSSPWLKLFQ
jgi:alpha-D-xyloside xylohydrolase